MIISEMAAISVPIKTRFLWTIGQVESPKNQIPVSDHIRDPLILQIYGQKAKFFIKCVAIGFLVEINKHRVSIVMGFWVIICQKLEFWCWT